MENGRQNKVQLGCGTLILIALIVMIFSNRGHDSNHLENEIKDLRQEISILNQKVDTLTRAILTHASENTPQPVATETKSGDEQTETAEPVHAEADQSSALVEGENAEASEGNASATTAEAPPAPDAGRNAH